MAVRKIAIVSDFRAGYEVALEACYARAFEALGLVASRISLQEFRLRPGGALGFLTGGTVAAVKQRAVVQAILEAGPELVVLVKGIGILADSVRALRREGIRVVNVFPDNPFEAARLAGIASGLIEQFRACDHVFVHDRFAVGALRELNVFSEFVAFARDPALHDPAFRDSAHSGDIRIAFVGNPDPERVSFLRAIADLGLGIWGEWSWAKLDPADPLAKCVLGGVQTGHAMVRSIGSAVLSVNLMRPSQKTAHNMRTFESPACRVCTLSEATNGVLELMADGVEVVTFSTPQELRTAALSLLKNPRRIREIAEAGWNRVQFDSYQVRAQQILDTVP